MKKTFIYASSILFASMLTIQSADAWGAKKTTEAVSTRTFGEADITSLINNETAEQSALTALLKTISGISTSVLTLVGDQKAFSSGQDPAVGPVLLAPVASIEMAAKTMLKANQLMSLGLKGFQKSKSKANNVEATATDQIEQAAALSNVTAPALATLRGGIVISDQFANNEKDEPTNVGKIEDLISKILATFEDRKKIFGKTATGEIKAEQALLDSAKTFEDQVPATSRVHAFIEEYTNNLKDWEKSIELLEKYLTAVLNYLKTKNTDGLNDMADEARTKLQKNGNSSSNSTSMSKQNSTRAIGYSGNRQNSNRAIEYDDDDSSSNRQSSNRQLAIGYDRDNSNSRTRTNSNSRSSSSLRRSKSTGDLSRYRNDYDD